MVSASLRTAALAAVTLALPSQVSAASSSYTLSDYFDTTNFANEFEFFNETDPTKGFVTYQSKAAAESSLLAGKTTSGAIYLGVDATNKVTSGRPSVRVSSTKAYGNHLMVADIEHMPYGLGVWGALWELGSGATWPAAGEIDILEGVNQQAQNLMTLHTGANCQMTNTPNTMTGNMTTNDCYINAGSAPGNAGCSVTAPTTSSFGEGFNAASGGVYAMEYSTDTITIWFFSRASIPADITSNSSTPDPSTWGTPVGKFAGSCDLASHFTKLQIVINTAICGNWAGTVWNQTDASTGKSPAEVSGVATCDDYAANDPSAFEQAYWAINSIRVYEPSGAAAASKRQEQFFGSYNDTESEDYAKCQEFTPGFCKSSSNNKVAATENAAGRTGVVSWAMVGLAAMVAVFTGF